MNIAKKITNAKNNELKPGEEVKAAMTLQDKGAIAGAAITGGLGGLLGVLIGRKVISGSKGDYSDLKESKMSSSMPGGMSIIGITDRRVVVYDFDSIRGKAKNLIAEFEKKDITSMEFKKGKIAHTLVMTFSDGGGRVFDLPRINKLDEFKKYL